MSLPSYIASNLDELLDNAPDSTLELIASGEIEEATMTLAANYDIPVGNQQPLSDLISYILIGALQPSDAVKAIQEMVGVDNDTAIKIATDLEHSVLEHARVSLLNKNGEEVKTLEYQGQKTKEELRKEIMDTTKRESGINKDQSGKPGKKTTVIAPGSRSQLLEQLQVIGSIPDDEEINERLKHIQEQISSIKKQEEDNTLHSNIALKSFMFGEKGKEAVTPTLRPATYSVAPNKYNVDPYREMAEEN